MSSLVVVGNQGLENNMRSMNHFRAIVVSVALGLVALVALPGIAGAQQGHKHKQKQSKVKRTQKVAIGFTALKGGKRVSCGQPITDLGTTSRTARLTDLRFYVSGVRLLRRGGGAVKVKLAKGSKWSYTKGKSAVTLIDLENGSGSCATDGTKAMNARVRGTVPRGKYVGVRYSVSVPEALNHTDLTATPAPLNITAMGWSWQFGRKFAKIEVSEDGGEAWASTTYFLHVGSTDCKGDPAAGEKAKCALPNRNQITLRKFNPAKQKIALDFQKLFAGVNVAGEPMDMGDMGGMDDSGDMGGMMEMPGCMSGTTSPDCGPLFTALGLKLGTTKKTAQTAFRVVRK
jgi:AZL_007920/MXAN_0976 family protein